MSQTVLTIQTLGFATGVALFCLLLALSHKAVKLLGDGRATRLATAMGLLWNLGNLAEYGLRLSGYEGLSLPIRIARAFAYSGTAFLSPGLFLLQFDGQDQQRQLHPWRWFISASYIIGACLTLGLFITAIVPDYRDSFGFVMRMSAYNLALHLAAGIIPFRQNKQRRTYRGAMLLMISALVILLFLLIHFALNKSWALALMILSQQLSIPMALVALASLGQFRFADVFVRQSFVVLAAVILAASYQWLVVGPLTRGARSVAAHPEAAGWIVATILWIVLLLLFPLIKQTLIYAADRWLFQHPDYSRLTQEFQQTSQRVIEEIELFALAEELIREALRVDDARIVAREGTSISDEEAEREIIYLRPDHPTDKENPELRADAL